MGKRDGEADRTALVLLRVVLGEGWTDSDAKALGDAVQSALTTNKSIEAPLKSVEVLATHLPDRRKCLPDNPSECVICDEDGSIGQRCPYRYCTSHNPRRTRMDS